MNMGFFNKTKILGCLDRPLHNSVTWNRVPVSGWVIPPNKVNCIEVSINNREQQKISMNTDSRPDIGMHFSRIANTEQAGFYGNVHLGSDEGRYEMEIRALLDGGDSYSLGKRSIFNSKNFFSQTPRFFHLGLTTRCNLSCKMCPVHVKEPTNREKIGDIGPLVLSRALTGLEASSKSVQRFFLADYGEPLLYPDIFKVISRVHEICPHASIHMNTNGVFLTGDMIKKIIDSDLNEISISLDAATKGTYQIIRRNGNFDRVVANLAKLVQMKKEYGKDTLQIHSGFVLLKSNIAELPDYVRLTGKIGVNLIVAIHPFGIFSGDAPELILEKNPKGNLYVPDVYMRIIRKAHKIAKQGNFQVSISSQQSTDPPFTPRFECRCHAASLPHVLPNGDVFPCGVLSAKSFEKISSIKPFGNLNNCSLEEIWLSAHYTEFRRAMFEGALPHPLCRQCTKYYNF